MTIRFPLKQAAGWWGIDRHSPYQSMLPGFIDVHTRQLAAQLPRPETKEDWLARRAELLPRLRHSLGLDRLPPPAPLDPQVVGTIERPAYTIEKIIYEHHPGFWVAAHLYRPRQADWPAPGVLYAPGHWMENGKLATDIQACCANLARLGFVVLVTDPLGQGERLGDWLDHGHLEPLLVGVSQEGIMVWESMRAIDYLISRPEVDPERIAMTGASGGGTTTFYTSAVDERIQASVQVCCLSTFLGIMSAQRDRNWEDGVDLCNQVPGVMALAEMSDICGLVAPRPLCIVAGLRDWMFPIEGVRQVYPHIEHIYRLLGVEGQVNLIEVDSEHGYDRAMRQTAYGWLTHRLKGEGDCAPVPEIDCDYFPEPYHPALTYIAPPDLADLAVLRRRGEFPSHNPGWCFPQGKAPAPGPAITALARQLAESLPPDQDLPTDRDAWSPQRTVLLDRLRTVLGPFPPRSQIEDRIFNQVLHQGLFAERVVFESEPGIQIPAMFLTPAAWQDHVPVVIYVDEWGKQVGLDNGLIAALLAAGMAVLAIDVRGVGETAATDFEATTNALMTDRPLLGQRVWDVLRAVDYLWRRIYISVQIDKGRIGCLGRGMGGLLALFAAGLDERLLATVMWEAPASYQSLVVERPGFPASAYPFDVLHHCDLPQLMATVAPRPLLLADVVDGERRLVPPDDVTAACQWPARAYRMLGAEVGVWKTAGGPDSPTSPDMIAGWLQQHL